MGNILWIASYPKSGNTWMRAFIENYLQNQRRPVDINKLLQQSSAESRSDRFQALITDGRQTTDLNTKEMCALRPLVHARIAREASGTAFVKTHNFLGEYKGFPLHNSAVTSGAIYLVRNPLDVAISMANYFAYPIDEAIDHMAEEMSGTPNEPSHAPQIMSSWSSHVESWTARAESKVLVLKYEDMLVRPQREFRKVESFLGLPKDPKRLKKAIEFSSFKTLKAQESQKGFVEKFEKAPSFFRRGGKSEWAEKLNESQIRRIVETHGEQMARFKYLPKEFASQAAATQP